MELNIKEGTISFGDELVVYIQIIGTLSNEVKKWDRACDNKEIGFPENLV